MIRRQSRPARWEHSSPSPGSARPTAASGMSLGRVPWRRPEQLPAVAVELFPGSRTRRHRASAPRRSQRLALTTGIRGLIHSGRSGAWKPGRGCQGPNAGTRLTTQRPPFPRAGDGGRWRTRQDAGERTTAPRGARSQHPPACLKLTALRKGRVRGRDRAISTQTVTQVGDEGPRGAHSQLPHGGIPKPLTRCGNGPRAAPRAVAG